MGVSHTAPTLPGMTMQIRMIADIMTGDGILHGNRDYDVPDTLGMDMIDLGWAELAGGLVDDEPTMYRPTVPVQSAEDHAALLRQRRGGVL